MDEVCDESRFTKVIAAVLKQARNGVRDGLGTAHGPEERNWGIAHRILAPHFAPLAIENTFDDMHDIAAQLVLKWARHGPEHDIEVTDDFTRLTLDAIALSAMDYRFNSFYRESMHPFIDALATFLNTNGDRAKRSTVLQPLCVFENRGYWGSIEELRKTGHAVISERKKHPSDKKDLLNAMLHGVDPETGEQMTVGLPGGQRQGRCMRSLTLPGRQRCRQLDHLLVCRTRDDLGTPLLHFLLPS